MAITKEQIIQEIQSIASRLGQKHVRQIDWAKNASISLSSVRYHFGNWNNAVKEAGLKTTDTAEATRKLLTLDDSVLLSDLLRLERDFGKVNGSIINGHGKFSERPYRKRWGTIGEALHAAKAAFQAGKIHIPVAELNSSDDRTNSEEIPKAQLPLVPGTGLHVPAKVRGSKRRSIVGEPIDFRGMRFAPVNEQGVVYLFGMVSQELGFLVESVRVKYPDCEGKRCCDQEQNLWEHIYIEFEYKSSNFVEHGHDVDECDIIVCWIHDWKECPIEVLELRKAIQVLPRSG
jgi:hypothetical protein